MLYAIESGKSSLLSSVFFPLSLIFFHKSKKNSSGSLSFRSQRAAIRLPFPDLMCGSKLEIGIDRLLARFLQIVSQFRLLFMITPLSIKSKSISSVSPSCLASSIRHLSFKSDVLNFPSLIREKTYSILGASIFLNCTPSSPNTHSEYPNLFEIFVNSCQFLF